jgi:uncharacterized protein involved in exopolysaccharide biosynthesis
MDEHLEPNQPVNEAQEARVEALSPDKRAELMQKSEELRTLATDIEARKTHAATEQVQDEAAAASIQERINALLGSHDILNVVRQEDAALVAIYERQLATVKGELSSIEAKLKSSPLEAAPAPSPVPPTPAGNM